MATKRTRKAAASKLEGDVTLVPVPGHWIPGVAAEEQTVDAERAAELLAYFPPAFEIKSGDVLPDSAAHDLADEHVAHAEASTEGGL